MLCYSDPSPLASGLINVNEFLPTDGFKWHNQVRSKAKENENTFSTFVQIYARAKMSDKPTLISSETDLSNFLESREISQNFNPSTLHPHPNRAASSLSSTIISSSSHTPNITSVNRSLHHTHATSSSFSSPNRLVATTQYFGDGLRVCCFNANSFLDHIETIRLFLASRPFYHIIAIIETKLTAQQKDHVVFLRDYVLIRNDRNIEIDRV